MNILDENIIESQCKLLRSWRIPFRQIGFGAGYPGIKDEEIIPLLHKLPRPTFFTRDEDFYSRNLCHPKYCIAHLAVRKNEAAISCAVFFGIEHLTQRQNAWARLFVFLTQDVSMASSCGILCSS